MLFGETVAVYCENHTEHTNTLCGQNAETLYIRIQSVPHRNTLRLRYRDQPVNAVWGNNRCLLWEPYGTHKYSVWAECGDFIYKNSVRTSQETHHVSATEPNRLMLLGEIIAVYCENHMEHINTLWAECSFFNVKAGGVYSYHCALIKGLMLWHSHL
jgi:hypothetical protein